MGVGAAVIFPTTLGLITNIFTDPVPRAKAIGLWAAMVGVGVAVGPISGGWLLEHFWWGSIFMVNIPDRGAGHRRRHPVRSDLARPGGAARRHPRPDPVRGRNHALVYTVIEAPTWGWTNGRTAAGFALAAIVLAGFALWERRSTHPMLDVSVFFNRRFSGGSLAVTAGFLTLFGFIFVITQYFQFIKDYTRISDRRAVAAGRRLDRAGQHPGAPAGRTSRHHRRRRRRPDRVRRRAGVGVHGRRRHAATARSPCRWCCSAAASA